MVRATRLATRVVGGVSGQFRQPLQLQHDLGVTEVLIRRQQEPTHCWIGEDAYRALWQRRPNQKVPDAVILDVEEEVCRVIEFGGQYSRERLQSFHQFWICRNRTPYEIW